MDLIAWLKNQEPSGFPQSDKSVYLSRLEAISLFLEREVFPHVEKTALLQSGGYLTDHGTGHINTVIRRAGRLLDASVKEFSAYEIYLLLASIYLHDAGNIYGREGHEQRVTEIITTMGPLLGEDSPEKRTLARIAGAHGGRINGSKDTISHLVREEHILGKRVHMQALAALLRFSDELAEGLRRAARFPDKLGKIPRKSEVYHQYAAHLHSVVPKPDNASIELRFQLTRDVACQKFGKDNRKVYLLDEIFDRSLKMHTERIYCMRFLAGIIRYEAINVDIEVYLAENSPTSEERIGFVLQERGYPSLDGRRIQDLCPDLVWTGQKLRDKLAARDREAE